MGSSSFCFQLCLFPSNTNFFLVSFLQIFLEHLLDGKYILSVIKRSEDLSKDNMIEEIKHPETNSLKYMVV